MAQTAGLPPLPPKPAPKPREPGGRVYGHRRPGQPDSIKQILADVSDGLLSPAMGAMFGRRLALGLSFEDLAADADVGIEALSRWRNGHSPRLVTFERVLRDGLGLRIALVPVEPRPGDDG